MYVHTHSPEEERLTGGWQRQRKGSAGENKGKLERREEEKEQEEKKKGELSEGLGGGKAKQGHTKLLQLERVGLGMEDNLRAFKVWEDGRERKRGTDCS